MTNLKKNLLYNFVLSISQVLIPLISIPYLSRVLDPAGIGRVGFIDSLTYYFVTIAEFGIIVYGTREVARTRHNRVELQKVVSELLALHLITSAVTLVFYGVAVAILWEKIGDVRLIFFSVSFLLTNFFACEWYFSGIEQFRYIAIRSLVTRVLGLASIFILIHQPEDYYVYYAIIAFSAAANLVWNSVRLFRELKISFRKLNWRRHIRYTWVIWVISLLYSVTIMLDNVILGIISGATAVGWYTFSIKFARIGTAILTDMLLVLYPRTVVLIREQRTELLQQTILKSAQLVILFSVPASVGLYLLADAFVKALLGPAFHPVAENIKILAILPFIKTYNLFLSKQILVPYNKEKLFLFSILAASLVFVVFAIILAPSLQDRGISYAILIMETVLLVLNYLFVKRTAPALRIFDWRALAQALGGTLLFIPAVYVFETWIRSQAAVLVLSLIACVAIYFLFQLYIIRNKLLLPLYQEGLKRIRQL